MNNEQENKENQESEALKRLKKATETAADLIGLHDEAVSVLYGSGYQKQRNAFLDKLSIEDYRNAFPQKPVPEGLKDALSMQAKTPSEYMEKTEAIYQYFDIWELIQLYERVHPQNTLIYPTSPTVFRWNRIIAGIIGGHFPAETNGVKQEITYPENKDSVIIRMQGKYDITEIEFKDKSLFMAHENRGEAGKARSRGEANKTRKYRELKKMFLFVLIMCNDQGFRSPVIFSIHDLVKYEMYSNYDNARKAVLNYLPLIYNSFDFKAIIMRRGEDVKGLNRGQSEGHGFISGYSIQPGGPLVTITLDQDFDTALLTEYFTILPKWTLSLDPNPFSLIEYVFYRAREDCNKLAQQGYFNLSFDAIRDYLGLPEYTGKDDYNRIKRPIMNALEKVEDTIYRYNDQNIKLTPIVKGHDIDSAPIKAWIQKGYLQVEMSGQYAEYFKDRAKAREEKKKLALEQEKRKQKKSASE